MEIIAIVAFTPDERPACLGEGLTLGMSLAEVRFSSGVVRDIEGAGASSSADVDSTEEGVATMLGTEGFSRLEAPKFLEHALLSPGL